MQLGFRWKANHLDISKEKRACMFNPHNGIFTVVMM